MYCASPRLGETYMAKATQFWSVFSDLIHSFISHQMVEAMGMTGIGPWSSRAELYSLVYETVNGDHALQTENAGKYGFWLLIRVGGGGQGTAEYRCGTVFHSQVAAGTVMVSSEV